MIAKKLADDYINLSEYCKNKQNFDEKEFKDKSDAYSKWYQKLSYEVQGEICELINDYYNKEIRPLWIIQENDFLENEITKLKTALDLSKTNYKSIQYDRFNKTISLIDIDEQNRPVILYGSKQFIKAVSSIYPILNPGTYGMSNVSCSDYYPNIPFNLLLNSDYIFTTWAEFSRNYKFYFSIYGGSLFIRPDSGMKTFSGQTVNLSEVEEFISHLDLTSGISSKTLILLSGVSTMSKYEHRFVIVDKKVVAGCSYSWSEENKKDYPEEALKVAQIIAGQEYQLDTAYTCDVVILPNGEAKVIELNSFSSAAMYECDWNKIVTAINLTLIKEYRETYIIL